MECNIKSPLFPDSKTEFLRKLKSNKIINNTITGIFNK